MGHGTGSLSAASSGSRARRFSPTECQLFLVFLLVQRCPKQVFEGDLVAVSLLSQLIVGRIFQQLSSYPVRLFQPEEPLLEMISSVQ